jgi:hypothetical protein
MYRKHRRLNLGTALMPQQLQGFLGGVAWLSLEELGKQDDVDRMLTLPCCRCVRRLSKF